MYLKAFLFLVIGLLSASALLLDHPHWKTLGLLTLSVWAFARLYAIMMLKECGIDEQVISNGMVSTRYFHWGPFKFDK